MNETMKSYHVTAGQGIGELETRQRPVPEPGPGEVLVRMRAGALSLRELKVLENDYPLPITPGVVAGCEGVGEVVALGDAVRRVKVGARVAASVFPQWIDGPFQFEYAAQLGYTDELSRNDFTDLSVTRASTDGEAGGINRRDLLVRGGVGAAVHGGGRARDRGR